MVPAGEAAIGFICVTSVGHGRTSRSSRRYASTFMPEARGGAGRDVGTGPWMRGLLRGLLTAEALRTAMRQFGNPPLTGTQCSGWFEHLTLTAASLKALGGGGAVPPLTFSCRDHEGGGGVKFQQWDGTQWTVLADWMASDQALVRPLVEASAAQYAQEKGVTPRTGPGARLLSQGAHGRSSKHVLPLTATKFARASYCRSYPSTWCTDNAR